MVCPVPAFTGLSLAPFLIIGMAHVTVDFPAVSAESGLPPPRILEVVEVDPLYCVFPARGAHSCGFVIVPILTRPEPDKHALSSNHRGLRSRDEGFFFLTALFACFNNLPSVPHWVPEVPAVYGPLSTAVAVVPDLILPVLSGEEPLVIADKGVFLFREPFYKYHMHLLLNMGLSGREAVSVLPDRASRSSP